MTIVEQGEQVREHDVESKKCLDVEFPCHLASTYGLTRPTSPGEREVERLFTLCCNLPFDPASYGN